ncbi:MAG: 2-hydroxyacid dehydrogenase [Nocardiopsaceae bacterium]|nr:2-hydroxyacid dehydrogenase [Nocardiopsaceae bacterium]
MRIWVPTAEVAQALAGLPEGAVDVVPGGGPLPAGSGEVGFYVPSFFPDPPAVGEVLRRLPALRVVQTLTAGVDKLQPYIPPGVTLCNARGAHDASTAEWVVAAMLAALRDFPYFAREQAADRWSYRHTGTLAGKTVLIVGYGSIGAAVERRLAGFEVTVRRVARRARDGVAAVTELPGLLPEADVVVILAPVTTETIGMVDAAFLARMKDGALLVNAARGSLVVTGALADEVRKGRLLAAADVTDPEPLPPGHQLWQLPGLFITPHVAASTPLSTARSLALVRAQAARWLAGEPRK